MDVCARPIPTALICAGLSTRSGRAVRKFFGFGLGTSALETLIIDAAHAAPKMPRVRATSQRMSELATNFEKRLSKSVERFSKLNIETKFVALNARIEARRTGGESGRAFDVVAQAIQDISMRTGVVAEQLSNEFHDLLTEMRQVSEELHIHSRGDRLCDLALANIDLIDRNLYERSCDVRWWATDQSVVDALVDPSPANVAYSSRRMGQILDSYTVYFDIVLFDLNGRVVANGRPNRYASTGSSHSGEHWFEAALKTVDGTEYVQSRVGPSTLCANQREIIFACTVRSGGKADGRPLGVLAVVFNWEGLAQTIVERTPLSPAEWERSRVCIVDHLGQVLADSACQFGTRLSVPGWNEIMKAGRGYRLISINDQPHCIGHAHSPGYETYRTGWYSVLLQDDSAV